MKKIVLMVMLMCVLCTSCKGTDILKSDHTMTPHEKIYYLGNEIIEGYKNKDKDRIKAVFTANQIEYYGEYIEERIEESFEFIDGEIIDYKEIYGSFGGGEVREGEWIYRIAGGSITEIRTDSGKEYRIQYKGYMIDKNDSNNVGISMFEIIQTKPEDNKSFEIK